MKTINIPDELWRDIAQNKISLGKKTMWEVIESYKIIAQKIKKEEKQNEQNSSQV